MKAVRHRIFPLTLLCLGLALTSLAHANETSTNFSRQLLFTKPVTLPGKEIKTNVIHVQFPVGFKTPAHTHEGPGPRYVLKGKLKVVDSGQTQLVSAGEVFWETGAEMTVENIGKGEAEILIFEMAPFKTNSH